MTGGITLALMLDFTPILDNAVRGIQGRYFTPFLSLVIYTLRIDKICIRKNLDKQLIFGSYMLNYFILRRILKQQLPAIDMINEKLQKVINLYIIV